MNGVHADRKRGAHLGRALIHHHAEAKILEALLRGGKADQPSAVLRHEVDGLRRDLLGGHDEVALVLPILIVHDDEHFALADVLYRFFN